MTNQEAAARQAAFDCRDTQCRERVKTLTEALTKIERELDIYLKHQQEISVKRTEWLWCIAHEALAQAKGATQ